MNWVGLLAACVLLAGCASGSVMQLDANTAKITVSAAPVCGDTGAQQLAYTDAAITTLRTGFDGFIVLGDGESSTLAGVSTMPSSSSTTTQGTITTNSTGNFTNGVLNVNSSTSYSGGTTIPFFSHKDEIVIRMFHATDPAFAQTVAARTVLGPKWAQKVANGMPSTCT